MNATKHIARDSQRSNENIKNTESCIASNLPMSAPFTGLSCLKEHGPLLKEISIFFKIRDGPF